MGCDIHASIEKIVDGRWIMVNRLSYANNPKALCRNYARFAALAGVRGFGRSPKGLPLDISESTMLYVNEWGGDGHSHSFLYLDEASKIFLATDPARDERDKHQKKYAMEHYFDLCEDEPREYRIIFWFDN